MESNTITLKEAYDITLKNKEIVMLFNKEFIEKGNTEILKEIVDKDFINHTAIQSVPKNTAGLIQFITMLHQGFSDFNIVIHEQIGENDIVATRKTIYARHTGSILGIPPTNKEVIFTVMDFVRLKDGKYMEHWGKNDVMQVILGL